MDALTINYLFLVIQLCHAGADDVCSRSVISSLLSRQIHVHADQLREYTTPFDLTQAFFVEDNSL